jgi:hypothetical protein
MQPWQAYQKKYYETKLKTKVDEAWEKHLSAVPEGDGRKNRFDFRTQLVQRFYEDEPDCVKEEIEEYRQAIKSGTLTPDVNKKNMNLQMYVSFLATPHVSCY